MTLRARASARGSIMARLHGAPPGPRMHRAPRHVPFRHFVVCSRDCVEFDSSTSVRKHRRAKRPRVDPLGAVSRSTYRVDRYARVALHREFTQGTWNLAAACLGSRRAAPAAAIAAAPAAIAAAAAPTAVSRISSRAYERMRASERADKRTGERSCKAIRAPNKVQ